MNKLYILCIVFVLIIFFFIYNNKNKVNENNINNYLTIGIKTFFRPHCLENCITHIRKYYKNVTIYVADDSDDEIKSLNKEIIDKFKDKHIKIFTLPYDSGLSKGRNVLVHNTNTKYYLTLDDDCYLNNKSDLCKMINFLENTNYDLIAGVCNDRYSENSHYSKKYIKLENTDMINIYYKDIDKKSSKIKNKYLNAYDTDQTLNLFIAKTLCLKKSPWDDKLKLGEHEMFFYKWWQHKYKCAITYDILFGEMKDNYYLKDKIVMRNRAYNQFNFKNKIKSIKL